VDFITQANCMTLNVEAETIDLSRPQLLLVRFFPGEHLDTARSPQHVLTLEKRPNRIHGPGNVFCRQLTKLDLASYKECVAVKEFALNRRPAKQIALRMGG
jgi:hypothetical protein